MKISIRLTMVASLYFFYFTLLLVTTVDFINFILRATNLHYLPFNSDGSSFISSFIYFSERSTTNCFLEILMNFAFLLLFLWSHNHLEVVLILRFLTWKSISTSDKWNTLGNDALSWSTAAFSFVIERNRPSGLGRGV